MVMVVEVTLVGGGGVALGVMVQAKRAGGPR